ncbi:bifunctional folylpolyglutamate synthase/dihydrofolate synthase [Paenibacillus mesophilus]|uniref:bifunctional folylpolyglutamate synthase/dihydrofolate synthase n=1 Tax=Paenibacillus mesophilus TaxID=2582849 RepID=UPI00110D33C9|nr:folylpolyglutamate synthase/dihydrofolate synthase family protein [Paenibacillus mesophilus]TMV52930.1 bifunctional folylpolyglutamate synthase/dihydrofolate synthase [Paenibacillus mesophilus]
MNEATESAQSAFRTADEAVNWITGRMKFGIRPGMKRMELFMEKLGHPHRRLKFIHVAGTNGKGSTCAFLTKTLTACGYDVGTFTSPFIERYQNRIQYNGKDIDDDSLVRLVNELKPIFDEIAETEWGAPTMFEVSTVLALLYFAKVTYPDFVVWETGLGGRLDSTNVVTPIVSVITNVGHDHMEILGDSLPAVAEEKAGIIKPGVPVVSAVEQPETIEVIRKVAAGRKSTLYLMNDQFRYEPVRSELDQQSFHFTGPFRSLDQIDITLNGAHQLKNAALALMTLEVLRQYYAVVMDEEPFREGMRSAGWPGRLEMVGRAPRVLVDGAHNPEGAETLAEALRTIYRYDKLHLMIAMMPTKQHEGVLRHLLPLADSLIVTEPDFFKKAEAGSLAELARSTLGELDKTIDVTVEPDWKAALAQLTERTGEDDLAVVTGTLYLISDVRSWMLYRKDSDKGW